MSSEFGKVAVLLGGSAAEREISLKSGETVLKGLLEAGVDAFAFDPKERPLSELKTLGVDRVFNVIHGRGGEDGTIQGALAYMGIPCTGSGVLGSALAMDKSRSKQLFKANNLATPPFEVVRKQQYEAGIEGQLLKSLGGIVFVKPANEGSSIGMNRAETEDELKAALNNAFDYDDTIIVEAFVDGPEYTVAIVKGKALPVIELRTPRTFYDYEAKYQSTTTEYLCPCDLTETDEKALQALAMAAFDVVGAEGWGRVDAMRGKNGEFYLLEVNTIPGMTAKSLVPMAAKVDGMSLAQLLLTILSTARLD